MKKIAISGYFNPLHVGHLDYIKEAKKLGDWLVVIVNNDKQVTIKGATPFMSQDDRLKIVSALRDVDEVFLSIDQDGSVRESLRAIKPAVFGNGGDRNNNNVPESEICKELNIEIIDGLGKKIRTSSEILKKNA